jgi:hypothetical protein
VGFELTTLVVIGTGCIGSCKSNYHTSTTMTTPTIHLERLEFNTNTFFEFDTTVVTPRLWVNKKHLKNNIKYHTYIFNLSFKHELLLNCTWRGSFINKILPTCFGKSIFYSSFHSFILTTTKKPKQTKTTKQTVYTLKLWKNHVRMKYLFQLIIR